MGQIGIWQIAIVVASIVNVIAFWKILPKVGMSKWVSLITIFPLIAMIMFWIVSFKNWPGDK